MELFLHNISISLEWEKKETAAPRCSHRVAGGRRQVGVCEPPRLAFFRCTIRYCSCIPAAPQQCKGQITKQGWLAASFALISLSGCSVPRGRWCRYSERE